MNFLNQFKRILDKNNFPYQYPFFFRHLEKIKFTQGGEMNESIPSYIGRLRRRGKFI